jgi:two-component system sensor histidine kinase BaeS
MQFGIKYKILATLFASIVIAVGGMWLLVTWSFDRGLVGYVSSTEQEMHSNLVQSLAEEYRSQGGWDSLRGNERRWRELHLESYLKSDIPRYARRYAIDPPDVIVQPGETFNIALPPVRGEPFTEPLPPQGEASWTFAGEHEKAFVIATPLPPPGEPAAGSRRMPPRVGIHFAPHARMKPRTALLDADKQPLLGRTPPGDPTEYRPILVDGATVGYLGIWGHRIPDALEKRFSERQARTFLIIALSMMLVAAVVGLPLSQRLVTPLRSLSEATRKLASGDYTTRTQSVSSDEIGQLSRDFNTLANTLEQNEKSRRQWIADISHELRTPLTVLRGEIEALQDGVRQVTPERLATLHGETMNLARLVDDLYELSLSDIGALSYRKEPLDLRGIVEGCAQSYADKFGDRRLRLELGLPVEPVIVLGDPDRLQQLVSNLLSNSQRYTDSGGTVEVSLSSGQGSALLEVQDTAPGVPPEHLPKLFDRLYRVEGSRSRSTGGAGLGLAIAKNIVEAHGGTIEAGNSPLGGLRVCVRLPLDT